MRWKNIESTCELKLSHDSKVPSSCQTVVISRAVAFPLSFRELRAFPLRYFATPQHKTDKRYTHAVNMPPKGSKKKAAVVEKTPAESTPTDVPAVVVSRRGTEYDTTAAAARPRRATATAPVQATANSKINRLCAHFFTQSTLTRDSSHFRLSYQEAWKSCQDHR